MILRPATPADAALLRAWRNDPETRAQSRNGAIVEEAEHAAWLATTLADDGRRLYIVEDGGGAVGTVRCDRLPDGVWELSWTVAPEYRGRGHGRAMVREAAARCEGRVCATIRRGHVASEAIARAAGMRPGEVRNGFALWRAGHND